VSLKETISNDLKAAFLGGNRFISDTLKGLKAVILNQEIALGKREEGLTDAEVEAVVQKEVKKRKESAEIYTQAGRDELAQKELDEMAILEKYLPQQLSEAEIEALLRQIIDEGKLTLDAKNQGMLIGQVKKRVGSAADGAVVARVVARLLNQ
jgi:hypothetical protein cdiviTM7_02614